MEKEKMFNEQRKQSFIFDWTHNNAVPQASASYEQMFRQAYPYEQALGKDLCEFTQSELKAYLEATASLRDKSKLKRVAMLKNYFSWCKSTLNAEVSYDIEYTDVTGINKLRRSMVSGPAHLQRILDLYYDPVEQKTVDNIYRCFFWLAFAGMEEADILAVKCKQVDTQSWVVLYGGKTYTIEREAIPAFKVASSLPFFMYYHPNYGGVYKDRAQGDTLVRGFSVPSITTVRNQISIRSRAAACKFPDGGEVKLSHYRVWLSGHFYRMYEMERAGVSPDFTELAEMFVSGKSYSNDADIVKRTIVRETRTYKKDYDRWKLAFTV